MARSTPAALKRQTIGPVPEGAAPEVDPFDTGDRDLTERVPNIAGISGEQLRSFIERIERLEEEKRTLAEDIKEIKKEAKGAGFQVKIITQLIKIRRMDKDDLDEQETLLDIYKRAIGMLP